MMAGHVPATTELGLLRADLAHAMRHHQRVSEEWDRTLELVQGTDFEGLKPGHDVQALSRSVEVWHDLTLEMPRHVAAHGDKLGLSQDHEERYGYLHRVFVGMEPRSYLALCDEAEELLTKVEEHGAPMPVPELRDRLVELMELGVRGSTRATDWLEKRISKSEGG